MLKGILPKTLSVATAAFAFLSSAYGQEVTLKVHHFLPATSPAQTQLIEPWAKQVEADSNGRIKVQIFPSMQLGGKPPQLYDQARDGVVDIVWTLPSYTPGRFPIVEVFELPFMANTAASTSPAVEEFSQRYLAEEFRHVHPLLFHTYDRAVLHFASRSVKNRDDLKGLKIRVPTQSATEALRLLGAAPLGMPAPEIAQAMTMGVIDGALLPWEVACSLRIEEVAKHHTEIGGKWGLYTAVFLFAMNKAKYESLPDDLKQVIDTNSGLELAKTVSQAWDKAEDDCRAVAEKRGNEFYTLPPEEAERWQAATQPVVDAWVHSMNQRGLEGEKLLEETRGLIEKYSQ